MYIKCRVITDIRSILDLMRAERLHGLNNKNKTHNKCLSLSLCLFANSAVSHESRRFIVFFFFVLLFLNPLDLLSLHLIPH